jgi:hypothetical protein
MAHSYQPPNPAAYTSRILYRNDHKAAIGIDGTSCKVEYSTVRPQPSIYRGHIRIIY